MAVKIEILQGGQHELIIDDTPFILRAAELNNSSFSSSEYMEGVWPKLVGDNINTVLGSVGWEQIEPEEGVFEFEEVDKVLEGARRNGLKVVILWFGAFKNGMSTYMPAWAKQDPKRFPRALVGKPPQTQDVTSLFNSNCLEADTKAFIQLMRHIKEFNSTAKETTVIVVQVENECGLRGDSRDRSDIALQAFESDVPQELLSRLRDDWANLNDRMKKTLAGWKEKGYKMSGSWEGVFGNGAEVDELFMAYHYAKYIEVVTSAGKKEYSLPMFVNAWQPYAADKEDASPAGGGDVPGIYPSGGPVPSVLDIYHHFAPSLDFISPDIYLGDYDLICHEYKHRAQPLFIPEQRRDEYGAIRLWSSIGTHAALGTSPFGIDTDPNSPFGRHYALLAKITPQLLSARREGRKVYGFYFDQYDPTKGEKDPSPKSRDVQFGEWTLNISRAMVFGNPGPGYGMIIQLPDQTSSSSSSNSRFMLVGEGFQVAFSNRDKDKFTSILSFRELDIDAKSGEIKNLRFLNGDETSSDTTKSVARMPGSDPDYGGFPIAISIPSRTRIAECVPYCLRNGQVDCVDF